MLGKNLCGYAVFSFDFFYNGGFVSCCCPTCSTELQLKISIYHSGKPIPELAPELISELLEKRIILKKEDMNPSNIALGPYTLWNMDATYEFLTCSGCASKYLAIFGMAEIQPGREEVQFKGVWPMAASYFDAFQKEPV